MRGISCLSSFTDRRIWFYTSANFICMCALKSPEILRQKTHISWHHDQLNTLVSFTNYFCEINLILSSYFRPVGAGIARSVLWKVLGFGNNEMVVQFPPVAKAFLLSTNGQTHSGTHQGSYLKKTECK